MQYIQNPEFFVDLGHEKVTSVSTCYVLYGDMYIQNPEFFVDLGHEKVTSVSMLGFVWGYEREGMECPAVLPDSLFFTNIK